MAALTLLGIVLAVIGLAILFIPTAISISLSSNPRDPFFIALNSSTGGLPLFFIFVIVGASTTVLGMIAFLVTFRKSMSETQYGTGLEGIEFEEGPVTENIGALEETIEQTLKATPSQPQPQPAVAQTQTRKETPTRPPSRIKVLSEGMDEVCPNCGSINPLRTTNCKTCGKAIYSRDAAAPECPTCGAPLAQAAVAGGPERLICSVCFSELEVAR